MKIGPFRVDIKVRDTHPSWWIRPASKASTVGAYVLAMIAIVLHFF